MILGPIVYRLGHVPFKDKRGVRFPLGPLLYTDSASHSTGRQVEWPGDSPWGHKI